MNKFVPCCIKSGSPHITFSLNSVAINLVGLNESLLDHAIPELGNKTKNLFKMVLVQTHE